MYHKPKPKNMLYWKIFKMIESGNLKKRFSADNLNAFKHHKITIFMCHKAKPKNMLYWKLFQMIPSIDSCDLKNMFQVITRMHLNISACAIICANKQNKIAIFKCHKEKPKNMLYCKLFQMMPSIGRCGPKKFIHFDVNACLEHYSN